MNKPEPVGRTEQIIAMKNKFIHMATRAVMKNGVTSAQVKEALKRKTETTEIQPDLDDTTSLVNSTED